MDYRRQAGVNAEEIGACLEMTQGNYPDLEGDYTILKRSYHHSSARQPNTSLKDLKKVSGDYAALYQREEPSPTRRPVPIHVVSFQIDDRVLTEAEVEAAVRLLRVNRVGATHTCGPSTSRCG